MQLESYFEIAGRAAAAHVNARGLPGHMREDLTQDALLWILEHPDRVRRAASNEKMNTTQVVSEIRRYYVTAGRDRYEGNEETFVDKVWTPDMVELVFPAVYDPEYTPFRDQTEEGERFAERDPSESGTWMAMIADVSSALDAYGRKAEGVRFAFRHGVLGEPYTFIATEERVSVGTAHSKVKGTYSWFADWLNGVRYEEVEEV